jgi:DNA-binding GntR family transcriptional regulator
MDSISDNSQTQRPTSTATARAASALRTGIIEGRLPPGHRLVELDISRELQMSRAPIREALRLLEDEGLVEREKNKGARVRTVSRQFLLELFAIREMLEGLAARLAAQAIDQPGNRAWLMDAARVWERAEPYEDAAVFIEENFRFHEGITRLAGNASLAAMMPKVHTPMPLSLLQYIFRLDAPRRARSIADHKAIIEAILEGNAVDAEMLMRRHVRRTWRLVDELPDSAFSS